jgi:hypothetical protein
MFTTTTPVQVLLANSGLGQTTAPAVIAWTTPSAFTGSNFVGSNPSSGLFGNSSYASSGFGFGGASIPSYSSPISTLAITPTGAYTNASGTSVSHFIDAAGIIRYSVSGTPTGFLATASGQVINGTTGQIVGQIIAR